MGADELVTVILPARNEEPFLGACLRSVRRQDYPNLQIVVVDGDSSDDTVRVVREQMAEDARIELLHNPRHNIPSSLNLAVARARGRWVVRVDAHCTLDADYVRTAVGRLQEGTWSGVGGRKVGVGQTPAGRAISVAMSSKLGVGNSTYHFGTTEQEVDHVPFGAYPLDVIRGLGGWDDRLTANEDFEFDNRLRRAGLRLLFDPRLEIHWHCRQSITDLYRQYRRYGSGKVDVARHHPGTMRLRHFVPPALVASGALGAPLLLRHPGWWLSMAAPYATAIALGSASAARQLDTTGERLRLPGAFVAMHVGWGIGFWSGLQPGRPDADQAEPVAAQGAVR